MTSSSPIDVVQMRKFGFVMPIPLTLIGAFSLYKEHSVLGGILLSLAAAFLILGLIAPKLLYPPYRLWMGFAVVMGYINSMIILTLSFLLLITPVALAMRILGKDPLFRKPSPDMDTYWIDRDKEKLDPARYERQF